MVCPGQALDGDNCNLRLRSQFYLAAHLAELVSRSCAQHSREIVDVAGRLKRRDGLRDDRYREHHRDQRQEKEFPAPYPALVDRHRVLDGAYAGFTILISRDSITFPR